MQNERLSCAIRAALTAGKDILEIYNDPKADFAIERKADNSPLTIADKRANERITGLLSETTIPILSEEGKHLDYDVRREWKTLWIVDPLDGTKEFIKRNGEFTVNIALVENGVPVMGVIYVPVARTLYFAEENIGAYKLNGIDCRSAGLSIEDLTEQADRLPLEQADTKGFVVVASRSHLSPETIYPTAKEGIWRHPPHLLRQLAENLRRGRRFGGHLSAFRPYHGMGYGGRARHRTGRRQEHLPDGREDTAALQQRRPAESVVHREMK